MLRGSGFVSALLALLVGTSVSTPAYANLVWAQRRGEVCETPSVFYSSAHLTGVKPCCPSDDGVCPGGGVCPATGVCAVGGTACAPTVAPRPNIILMVSDDQGECHYGSAAECRSARTGTPISAPMTPNLDGLAAVGTVFPIAHNTASWCYPSLNSLLTGRYQKSFGGLRSNIGDRFLTIPRALRQLGRVAGTVTDPFDAGASIGGYCTMQGGKFTAASGRDPGFDASVEVGTRKLGRLDCRSNPQQGGTPLCGSDASPTYDPFALEHLRDVLQFIDGMVYKMPGGAPGEYTMQQFFTWYAPRIPHQPLRAPQPIETYLFGNDGQSGFFQLGQLCLGSTCPPAVTAFSETNFGSVRDYYAEVYLLDANVRELRKFLAAIGAPHCIGSNGRARLLETTPQTCNGTWATSVSPDPTGNTILLFLSDNGWQLPSSKHAFSENGYRTRMIVYDPRNPAGGHESDALAHSTDLLPSLLGFALDTVPGTQACPPSDFDGTACDGRDLRAQLGAVPLALPTDLRHSLCGHETRRPVAPSRGRYLLTTPATVGRCTLTGAPGCATDLECGAGRFCLGGHCVAEGGKACQTSAGCDAGSFCLEGKCQAGAPCIDDATCTALVGQGGACAAKGQKWCANAPDVSCTTRSECPECPTVNGRELPCRRLCQPRLLKMYDTGFSAKMTDLFLDPDEIDVHAPSSAPGSIAALLSNEGGPYGGTLRKFGCCLDDWWSGGGTSPVCAGGTCPAELTCNR